jgi:microcystin-dependent protein
MANDKSCLHLPLDEIRVVEAVAAAPNVGGIGVDALVRGNPQILHDPTMGTCMRFDGDGDAIELTDLAALTFAEGMTAMAWVRFEETAYFSRIFDLNVAPNQRSNIIWAGNEERSQHLALEMDGIRFRIENGVALRQWRHLAFVYDPAGKVSVISDGALVFSKEVTFDLAHRAWQTGYLGKSSWTADQHFRGAMAHFRLYNQALTLADVRELMIADKSAMAYYRETTLLKVELYTIRDDDHKPVLYVEADNKGEPLELSLTNPGDKPVTFKPFGAPTADDFHVQLRFRRNVIAPNVLRALQAPNGVVIDGWLHAAGVTADGREDYLSLVKSDASLTLGKGEAWRIQIPNFSAAAQGGARNTRIQVRYRTEPQDPGSVIRHMEVQSHLGLKTIPLIARFRDSNTLLNNGVTSNELTIEVVCTSDTSSVRLDEASRFELIIDDDLLAIVENDQVKSVSSLGAVSRVGWLEAEPAASGAGHKAIAFRVKRQESGAGAEAAALLEVDRQHPLVFELSNWLTNKPSGMYNILLRYENIPGYWEGAWVLPVQFSPLLLRSDKIGIGTDEPKATLHVNGNTRIDGSLNVGGSADGAIDVRHINGKSNRSTEPDVLQLNYDNGKDVEIGSANTAANLVVHGRVTDRTGDVMPVGAILAYGGQSAPPGWLLCDGQTRIKDTSVYSDLYKVLGSDCVPDLRSRFIVGVGKGSGIDDRGDSLAAYKQNETGGEAKHKLDVSEMPEHTHKHKQFVTWIGSHEAFPKVTGHADWEHEKVGSGFSGSEEIPSEGGVNAHNNLPPYYALTYIIKY